MTNLTRDSVGTQASVYGAASAVLAACLILLSVACHPKAHLSGQVHGFVVAQFVNASGAPSTEIFLPDISVYLKNTATGKHSAQVKTNALGFFITENAGPGTYNVCAEAAGFVAACDSKVVTIVDGTAVLDRLIMLTPEGSAIQGRVAFKDGSPCFQNNERFATFASTKVSLHNTSGALINQPRPANSNGYYVLPQVPGAGTYKIEANCDGFQGSATLSLSGLQLTGGTPVSFPLINSQPQITSVTASLKGTMVQQADPGSTVTVLVRAYDPDGDTLHYRWTDGSKGFPTQDSSTIQWTLPTTPQANFLIVEARDGKGGYARGFVSISTNPWQPVFGGKVLDRATGLAVAGAAITINGERLVSAANGRFQYSGVHYKPETKVATGMKPSQRYVVNVRKPGYALLSRVVYGVTPQMTLYLDRATRTACNPTTGCAARDHGPAIETQVQLSANSIVDQNGNSATVPVNVDVHGYDMTLPNPIPGDFAALDKSGNSVTMNSFGAISVDLSDASGNSYNLAPGKTAKISIPVNISALGGVTPPPTLPLWSYNEQTGVWQEQATATYDATAHAYVGDVSHFSAWNADAVFSNTACVFISIDPNTGPEIPFQLRGAPTNPPGYVNHDFTTDPSDLNGFAFYRLIPNSVVKVEIHPTSGPDYVMGTFTVNAGPTIDGTVNYDAAPYYGIPPNPATQCLGYDLSTNQPPVISLTIPTSPTFLTGLAPASPSTTQYWEQVGALDSTGNPTLPRSTFTGWLQTNGLGQGPGGSNSPGEVEAIYFNNADLQFGRDMHCLQGSGTPPNAKVACYVTNYGQNQLPQGDPQTGIINAEAHSNPIATVAMEYNPGNAHNVVSFFAYKANGHLLPDPALDSQITTTKPIPQICIACHGGTINGNNVDNANFIAFDIYSFLYDNSATAGNYGISGPSSCIPGVPSYPNCTPNQQETFRQLNASVWATNSNAANTNSPIINLINGWYAGCGGVNTTGCAVNDTYAPPPPTPGWAGHTALYQTIPRVYCRNCHSSMGSPSSPFPDWTQYSDFNGGLVPSFVCTSAPLMPYAQVPFKRFWLSANPSAPQYLADPTLGLNITGGCPR